MNFEVEIPNLKIPNSKLGHFNLKTKKIQISTEA